MNLDIDTEHVLMRAEWHRTIEERVARCTKAYPELTAIDVRLRHDEQPHPANRADVAARGRGRSLQAAAGGECMATVLDDVFDALERELAALHGRHDRAKAA